METLITIFTPAYNRAHTLPRLYESLLKQTNKNFEWLIVDDGSTDGTQSLIAQYITDNKINIRYIYQNNGGKHRAINRGVGEANGDYFLVVDSDDFLANHCVEECYKMIYDVYEDNTISGFTFIRTFTDAKIDCNKVGKFRSFDFSEYQWDDVKGEMSFCYKTSVLRQYPFPDFEEEKFCPESLIHNRIGHRYKVLYTDRILAFGDYLEGGLTSNYYKLLINNPRYAMLWYSEKIKTPHFRKVQKETYANGYWDIALKAKHIPWVEKLKGIPVRYTFMFFAEKIRKIIFSSFYTNQKS